MKLREIDTKVNSYTELINEEVKDKERKRLRNRRKRGLIDLPTKTIRRRGKK